MPLFSKDELQETMRLVHAQMPPTPQYVWPQISEKAGAPVWVKHENHTPTGAFKIRGGVTFMDWLKRTPPSVRGIITATRGNHGQSQARAAAVAGLKAKIVAAMRAFGGELIEFGTDFDQARIEAMRLAEAENLFMIPPYHKELVRGVATYGLELFTAAPHLDTVYVPIGCGSGICGLITVRDALGLRAKIVGVVSTAAQTARLSVEAGHPIATNSAETFADGMAVRVLVEAAFDIYSAGVDHIIAVNDDQVADAVRIYFHDTHNVAEGAGAAPLAALLQERKVVRGRRGKELAVILSRGNVDASIFATVLKGETPKLAQ